MPRAERILHRRLSNSSQSARERKAKALGRAEIGVAVWAGTETMQQFEAATLHHRTLLGVDRRRAIISTILVLAGVVCSSTALWMQ